MVDGQSEAGLVQKDTTVHKVLASLLTYLN